MNELFTPSERMNKFRAALLNRQPRICVQRAIHTTAAYRDNIDQPLVIVRARALANVLMNMDIYIEPDTLLAGNQASSNRAAPIFPEYAMDWVIHELDEFDKRPGDRFHITEQEKQVLREIAPFWQGRTLKERALTLFPEGARTYYDLGLIHPEGNITAGDAHIAVSYEQVLSMGLNGFRERTKKALNSLSLTDMQSIEASHFYRAILIVLDAMESFANRYADLAEEQASAAPKPRKYELLELSRILRKVPMQPAETFHEALQSVWLVHLALQIESNGHSLSYGRMDQYLQPYYLASKHDGMEDEEALMLLENLWIKTLTINKVRSWSHTQFSAGSPLYQNVTIGGQSKEGKDAVNEMSYLILQSVANMRLPQPNLTVRYHHGLSDHFMRACIEVVRLGFGMPAFNSDEVIIPSFIARGVAKEDAYNYSAIGCVEVAVPGKWGYRCTGMSFVNFPKALLIAMNDGVDPHSGVRICEGNGHFMQMESFDHLMHAWDFVIRDFTRWAVCLDTCADMALEATTADVLCSALTEDCIGRGKHLKQGGAVYDFISQLQVGIANLADSLSAIKRCVYEQKTVTREQLWHALMDDFAGDDGEQIRELLLSAPKYGNDNDAVDQLIVQAYDSYLDEISHHHNTRYGRGPIGGTYYAGTSSISANVPQGASTGATPDGRHAGEPLAEGCSPSHAMDTQGPTAVFKSVSKLRTDQITGGVLLNQKLTPQMLMREQNRTKLILMLRTFFDVLKGFHVQYNVVSRDTLLDAQAHPEKHRDLVVRVAGYSAFFHVLSKRTQDDIIARTEQTL
ncbi:glycyl radical protein [Eubacteriales bacterium OttesenSCG-928-N13]|nr:glycyl radical protein [Eubacteriales bacterium OttesenSCG-928-N13]